MQEGLDAETILAFDFSLTWKREPSTEKGRLPRWVRKKVRERMAEMGDPIEAEEAASSGEEDGGADGEQ